MALLALASVFPVPVGLLEACEDDDDTNARYSGPCLYYGPIYPGFRELPMPGVLPPEAFIRRPPKPRRSRRPRRRNPWWRTQFTVPLTSRHATKARSTGTHPLTKGEKAVAPRNERYLRRLRLLHVRPETRADCKGGIRPCPWVSCQYSLYLDVKGEAIKLNFPDLEPHQMGDSCVLDIVDRRPDGISLERVGRKLNLTMERVRQVQEEALEKVKDAGPIEPPDGFKDDED